MGCVRCLIQAWAFTRQQVPRQDFYPTSPLNLHFLVVQNSGITDGTISPPTILLGGMDPSGPTGSRRRLCIPFTLRCGISICSEETTSFYSGHCLRISIHLRRSNPNASDNTHTHNAATTTFRKCAEPHHMARCINPAAFPQCSSVHFPVFNFFVSTQVRSAISFPQNLIHFFTRSTRSISSIIHASHHSR